MLTSTNIVSSLFSLEKKYVSYLILSGIVMDNKNTLLSILYLLGIKVAMSGEFLHSHFSLTNFS